MTPQGWIYLLGALVCWRFFAGAWHRSEKDHSHSYHPIQAVIMGAFMTLFWPAALLIAAVVMACLRWPDAAHSLFIHEPSRARLERRRVRRQAEVEQLERDLGL